MGNSNYDLRFILKSETPYTLSSGIPTWVRLRKRTSFRYKQFSYDFSIVKEGPNVSQAQLAPPRHEIEIECINLLGDPSYLAKSLTMKAADLLH